MNNFKKTLLTAALAWACIVIPNIAWQALGIEELGREVTGEVESD